MGVKQQIGIMRIDEAVRVLVLICGGIGRKTPPRFIVGRERAPRE
jgi:hypothetical protein